MNSTKSILLNLIENYSLRDVYLNPPRDFNYLTTDFVEELQSLNPLEFNSTFLFYFRIRDIFKKARDIHFKFVPPCFTNLFAVLPFDFVIEDINGTDCLIIEESSDPQITDYYLNKMDGKNILGKKITKISTHDMEEINGENPIVTLNRWSYYNVFFLKNELGRFSTTLAGLFSARPLTSYNIPKFNITIKYENEIGKEEELDMPFLLYSRNDDIDVDSLCSKVDQDDDGLIYYLDCYRELKKVLELNMKSEDERLNETRYLEILNTLNVTDPVKIIHHSRRREYSSDFFYSDDDISLKESLNYKAHPHSNRIKGLIQKENKLIILAIRSFSFETMYDELLFCRVVVKTIRLGIESSCDKILFNVIDNGGGNIELYKFIEDLLWSKRNPLDFSESMPKTPFNYFANSEPQLQGTERIYTDRKIIIRIFDHEGHLEDFKDADKIIPSERRRNFTKEFITTAKGFFSVVQSFFKEDISIIQSKEFKPENVLVLTDGHCSSSCASFVKYISMMGFGSAVTIGKKFFGSDIDDISEGVEGVVMNIHDPKPLQDDIKPYFFYRNGTEVSFSVTLKYSLKESEKEIMDFVKIPPDYRINKFVNYKKLDDTEYLKSLANDCLPFFKTCKKGMVQKDNISCPQNITEKKKNFIKGHPCITKEGERAGGFFSKTQCSFAGCVDGFYYKDNRCFKILEWGEENSKHEESLNKYVDVNHSLRYFKNKDKKRIMDEL